MWRSIPAISSFLTETVNEKLKKPLQPAGLFASAIFVLLNLLFVYGKLLEKKIPLAVFFRDLQTTWQVVLLSVLVVILSYLLLSFHSGILKLFTGELWANSLWLAPWLRRWQKKKKDSISEDECADIVKQIKKLEWSNTKSEKLDELIAQLVRCRQEYWERKSSFAEEEGRLAPTALGNVLYATISSIWQRHRMDMPMLWPYMEATLATKDQALRDRINDEKATLDFFLNMAFVLMAFWVEYVVMRLFWPDPWWSTLLVTVIVLLVAYVVFYRTAVGRARAWGRAVQMAFDLHREPLREALGLRKFKSRAHEREVWKDVSYWLSWGTKTIEAVKSAKEYPFEDKLYREKWKEDAIFEGGVEAAQPQDASVRQHSDNVKVSLSSARRDGDIKAPGQVVGHREYIEYVLIVSNAVTDGEGEGCGCQAEGIFILISDPRVPSIETAPTEETADLEVLGKPSSGFSIEGKIIPADKDHSQKDDLLWHINQIPADCAITLHYTLPAAWAWKAKMVPADPADADKSMIAHAEFNHPLYSFIIERPDKAKGTGLTVFDHRVAAKTRATGWLTVWVGNVAKRSKVYNESRRDGYRWKLGDTQKAHLMYSVKED